MRKGLRSFTLPLVYVFLTAALADADVCSPTVKNSRILNFAHGELIKGLEMIAESDKAIRRDQVDVALDSIVIKVKHPSDKSDHFSEGYTIKDGPGNTLIIEGCDERGALWGVRDFVHYYAKKWITDEKAKPGRLNVTSSPAIKNRGLWSWWYGCYNAYGYIDRASEWKLNTVIFWNRGVPMDADQLVSYAHERGVDIWWGFSWGWTAQDFKDASPELARKLLALYEKQKKTIDPNLDVLCPMADETPAALMEYVLDVMKNQYAWIPGLDGIYFQTATEAKCHCDRCKAAGLGKGFVRTILPIIEEIHKRYPNLKISCGVHNTGDIETFKALKQIPSYANICWEAGVTWAPNIEIFRDQMTYRGSKEDIAGVYRIAMNCSQEYRNINVSGEPVRNWLGRVEALWDYLEEGHPDGDSGFKQITIDGKNVGYPCSSDWRPPQGRSIADNENYKLLLAWTKEMAQGKTANTGVLLLVEAALIDLKMRRVPAITSEILWDARQETELAERCDMIWTRKVGGWMESKNPYWNVKSAVAEDNSAVPKELGDIYQIIENDTKKKSDNNSIK